MLAFGEAQQGRLCDIHKPLVNSSINNIDFVRLSSLIHLPLVFLWFILLQIINNKDMYPIYVRRIRFKVDSPERTIRPIIFCYARQLGTIDFVDTHIYNVVKDHLLVNENDSSLVDIMQVTELSNTILTINNEEELNSYFNNKKGVNGMVAYFQSSFITENLPQSLYYKLPKRIEINTADFGFVDLPIFPHN